MEEVIRKVAAMGLPGVILVVVMATTGLTGAAAITSALAILGGPAGMLGGIAVLGITGTLTDILAKFGIELVLMRIYEKRSEIEPIEKLTQEIDKLPFISSGLKRKLTRIIDKKIVFVLVGRTGVGKSSTVNSLLGREVAKVGNYEPTTMSIESYEYEEKGTKLLIIDTPGLCDDLEEVGNDQEYLNLMRAKIPQMDSMWFVSRLDETRVTNDEKRGIKLVSETFGAKGWEYAVIVFTFANSVPASRYQEALDKRTELIKREIAKYAGEDIANTIPSVAVDNNNQTTPDGKQWLGEFFTKVFVRVSESGSLPLAAAMKDSLSTSTGEARISLNEQQKAEVKKKINKGLIGGLAYGGAVVGQILGPGGIVVGGLLGTVVGLWLELDRKNA
ncbi:GTPase [Nostoc sp. CCY0012]|uniref:GTPase n=1 Tax=Nostoc sp. CCY0012 TaxID=1056123 RepID=UPI0039C6D921